MNKSKKNSLIKNQKGQTLIEYLIIVSLLGVGSIVIMSNVGKQLNGRFAKVIEGLGGSIQSGAQTTVNIKKTQLDRKNLSNFDDGAKEESTGTKNGNANDGE